jgi:hypothetical protein
LVVRNVAILAAAAVSLLGCRGCEKTPPPPPPPRPSRVDVTVALGASPGLPADAVLVDPSAPPAKPQLLERSGIKLEIAAVPDGDAAALMKAEIAAAYAAGVRALVFVTTRCLAELEPILTKDISSFWFVPLVVGAGCDRPVQPTIGAATLVAAGTASRVTITFEATTQSFLKVRPDR